jgi:hypothetical protein
LFFWLIDLILQWVYYIEALSLYGKKFRALFIYFFKMALSFFFFFKKNKKGHIKILLGLIKKHFGIYLLGALGDGLCGIAIGLALESGLGAGTGVKLFK